MCLYNKLIKNKKYQKNKKNGGNVPIAKDKRVLLVPVACHKCMECKQQKSREWTVRLNEDIKEYKNGKFVTFTFSEESLTKLTTEINPYYEGYDIDNEIATLAIDRFLKRWINNGHPNLRHWLVTELGQNNTERIHLHGIIWTDQPKAEVLKIWQYGNMGWKQTWAEERNYVNGDSIGYLVKYLSKIDLKHPNYQSKILASKGIGKNYTNTPHSKENKYNNTETKDYYKTSNGHKTGLPIYYRNKLYTETEREQLWLNKLDKQERYVNGLKYNVATEEGEKAYWKALSAAQRKNTQLGYGSDKINWEQKEYEKQLRNLKKEERIKNQMDGKTGKKQSNKNKVNPPQDPRQSSGEIIKIRKKNK